MPSRKIELDDHQRFILMKFRRSVADVTLPHYDDNFLLRWLKARNWNPDNAEKMLRESLKWRQQWEVDGALKTWKAPECLELYHPSGISGYDKDGAPIIIVPFAGFDIVGLINSTSRQDMVRLTVQTLEKYLDLAVASGENKVIAIFDMEGFNLKAYTWRPAAEVVLSLIQMYEANYPEILKACYIVNAPRVFAIAFNVVKRFLNELTIGKIQIYKSDPKKWKKVLLENIEPDNLPKHFGGTLTDPDGNPHLATKIKQGGKVPKECYKKHLEVDNVKEYTTVVIKKGDKLTLDFIVAEDGCFLKWDFRTEGHDIRFGVTLKDAEENTSSVVRHARVAAHQLEETGMVACQAPATYTVTFDNSYSMMRSKKLHYNVYVTQPIEKIDINIDPNQGESAEQDDLPTTSSSQVYV